ncbi:hypothetical protein QBC41DRAFT_325150 [Cercophora samala]|uniref:BTB domain-containing protein n=1 Tax=Cercophora samala TaxID=330535 RepID=A0AA39ZAR1_9PEZI|nr:hypothetical protein QBC41DRAFT_325150 [Cercophora samala]
MESNAFTSSSTILEATPPQYNEITHNTLEQVALDVNGHKFTTTINVLTAKSLLFKLLLQGNWKSSLQADNSIFVDSDPEIFRHVLQYLRRGVFPLVYDQKKGHNYKLYADILAEAKHFGIPKLECWLTDQLYLRCITSSTVWSSAYKNDRIENGFQITSVWGSDVTSTQLVRQDVNTVKKVICNHQANDRSLCPKKPCVLLANGGLQDGIEIYRWTEVGRSIRFIQGWCNDSGNEFIEHWERVSRARTQTTSEPHVKV